jgi:hypothetical protein
MNLHTQRRTLYFARAGKSQDPSFKADAELSPEGKDYAQKLAGRVLEFRREEEERELAQGDKPRSLIVQPPLPSPISPDPNIARSGHQPVSAPKLPPRPSPLQ